VRASDIQYVHQLHSCPEVDQYNTLGIPENIEQTQAVLEDWLSQAKDPDPLKHVLRINKKDTEEFVGLIGINIGKPKYRKAEIWFKILPKHFNQGYTTEAVKSVLAYCFNTLLMHRIEAGCATENIASKKVLEKAGMQQEGLCRQMLPIRNEWKDGFYYAILQSDFLNA
jgi:[ribosomal protein S5]-alanine N-acetyltransferase